MLLFYQQSTVHRLHMYFKDYQVFDKGQR